ncbi:MAG: hypothetical protein RJA35_887 [Actinomycetota bacterium]
MSGILGRAKDWFIEDGRLKTFWVVALVLGVALLALQRVTGNLPNIMGDELIYQTATLHQPLSAAGIPDYLYYWVYGGVGACGIGFYGCSQVLNVVFSMAAGLLVFSIGSRFAPAWASAFVAIFFVLGPLSAYNSYFMPEAMYFFFFALVIWNVTRPTSQSPIVFWSINGALLGLLSLVKPHGLLLAPAIVTYILVVQLVAGKGWIVRWIRDSAAFGVVALAVKFALGFAFAGSAGLVLFGNAYTGQATPNALKFGGSAAATVAPAVSTGAANHFAFAPMAAGQLTSSGGGFGFIMGATWMEIVSIAFISLLPLAATISAAFKKPAVVSEAKDGGLASSANGVWKLSVLALSILVWMAPLIGVFSNIANNGGDDTVGRVLLRYFEFLVPMFLIPLAAYSKDAAAKPLVRWAAVAVSTILAIIGFSQLTSTDSATGAPTFNLMFADSAFLKLWAGTSTTDSAGAAVHWVGVLVLILSICGALLWAVRPSLGAKLWIGLVLPVLLIVSSNVLVANPVWRSNTTLPADTAGEFVRDMVPARDYGNLMIVTTTSEGKTSDLVKFHINSALPQEATVADGTAYSAPAGAGIKWVLAVGRITLADKGFVIAQSKGLELLRIDTGDVAIFNNASYTSPFVAGTTGFDNKSALGMCATATPATIRLASPIQPNTKLAIGISGSPSLPNEQVTVGFGAQTGTITLNNPNNPLDLVMTSSNTGPTDTITFAVPRQAGAGMCVSYLEIVK